MAVSGKVSFICVGRSRHQWPPTKRPSGILLSYRTFAPFRKWSAEVTNIFAHTKTADGKDSKMTDIGIV